MSGENNCIFEMFDFMKFSRANEEFKGTCLFKVEKDGETILRSVRLEPEQPVVVFDGRPPDGNTTVEITLNFETFNKLYLNELDATNAVLTGKVRVKYFKYSALSSFMGSFDMSSERWAEYYKWKANEDKRMAKFAPLQTQATSSVSHHVSQTEALLQHILPYAIRATRDTDDTAHLASWPPILSHFDNGTSLPPRPANPAVFRQNLLALARVVADAHELHTNIAPAPIALGPTPSLNSSDPWSSVWTPVASLFTSAPPLSQYGDMEPIKDTLQALAALADTAAETPVEPAPSVLSYITGLLPLTSAPTAPSALAVSLGVAAYHRLGPEGDALPELLVTEAERLANEGVVLDYTMLQQQRPVLQSRLSDADPAIDARVTRWLLAPEIDAPHATLSSRRVRFLDYFSDHAVPIDGSHFEEPSEHIVKPLPPFAPSTEPRRVLADLERALAHRPASSGAGNSPASGPSTPLSSRKALSAALTAVKRTREADTSPPELALGSSASTALASVSQSLEGLSSFWGNFRARSQTLLANVGHLVDGFDSGLGSVAHAQELAAQEVAVAAEPIPLPVPCAADAPPSPTKAKRPMVSHLLDTMRASIVHPDRVRQKRNSNSNQ